MLFKTAERFVAKLWALTEKGGLTRSNRFFHNERICFSSCMTRNTLYFREQPSYQGPGRAVDVLHVESPNGTTTTTINNSTLISLIGTRSSCPNSSSIGMIEP